MSCLAAVQPQNQCALQANVKCQRALHVMLLLLSLSRKKLPSAHSATTVAKPSSVESKPTLLTLLPPRSPRTHTQLADSYNEGGLASGSTMTPSKRIHELSDALIDAFLGTWLVSVRACGVVWGVGVWQRLHVYVMGHARRTCVCHCIHSQ